MRFRWRAAAPTVGPSPTSRRPHDPDHPEAEDSARILRCEVFGPVAPIVTWTSERELLAMVGIQAFLETQYLILDWPGSPTT